MQVQDDSSMASVQAMGVRRRGKFGLQCNYSIICELSCKCNVFLSLDSDLNGLKLKGLVDEQLTGVSCRQWQLVVMDFMAHPLSYLETVIKP